MMSNTEMKDAAVRGPDCRYCWGLPAHFRVCSRTSGPGTASPPVGRPEEQCLCE